MSLYNHDGFKHLNVSLEIGRIKNKNKNTVAEKAVQELEEELLRQEPGGGSVSETGLAIATARLNSRLRHQGVSSRELWAQRNQFTNGQLPLSDHKYILSQHKHRTDNHPYSEKAKNSRGLVPSISPLQVAELVYLVSDRDKSRARDRYLVTSIDGSLHGATSRNLQVLNFVLHRTKSNYLNATPSLLLLLPPTIQTTTMMTGSTIAANRQTPTKNSLIPSPSTSYDLTIPHAPNPYRCKTTTI